MDFLSTYEADIKAFFDALIDFIKGLIEFFNKKSEEGAEETTGEPA